jgi:hypothetical protein
MNSSLIIKSKCNVQIEGDFETLNTINTVGTPTSHVVVRTAFTEAASVRLPPQVPATKESLEMVQLKEITVRR